jgi:DNA-damage-inducible protein J
MARTATIRTRVEAQLKAEVEAVLDRLGLSAGDAIRLFYQEVAARQSLPFEVAIPNEATRRALRDVEQGRGLTRYKDTQEMFDKLGLP